MRRGSSPSCGAAGRPPAGAEAPGGRPDAGGREPASCLEVIGNTVPPGIRLEDRGFRVKSCVCRSRFCPCCCGWLGRDLRGRLVEVLGTYQGVYTLTLTVDPENFPDDPEGAFRYVLKRRCIAKLVEQLHKLGHLHSRRYFVVVEWQRNGYPHWHVVLDATFIPFVVITATWDRFRPSWLGPPVGRRPPMGSSRFTKKFAGGADAGLHAARYVAKYLTKHPADGYPDWVLGADYRIRRYSTSRGFWGAAGEPEPAVEDDEGEEGERERVPQTIRQRVESCQQFCNVFRVVAFVHPVTGEEVERDVWVCRTDRDIGRVCELATEGTLENWYCIRIGPGAPAGWFSEWVDVWRGGRAAEAEEVRRRHVSE